MSSKESKEVLGVCTDSRIALLAMVGKLLHPTASIPLYRNTFEAIEILLEIKLTDDEKKEMLDYWNNNQDLTDYRIARARKLL